MFAVGVVGVAWPMNSGVCEGIPPLHAREFRIFGSQSEADLIPFEALGLVVPSKREWFIRTAKLNRAIQRIVAMMTMAEVLADYALTGSADLHLAAAVPVA